MPILRVDFEVYERLDQIKKALHLYNPKRKRISTNEVVAEVLAFYGRRPKMAAEFPVPRSVMEQLLS